LRVALAPLFLLEAHFSVVVFDFGFYLLSLTLCRGACCAFNQAVWSLVLGILRPSDVHVSSFPSSSLVISRVLWGLWLLIILVCPLIVFSLCFGLFFTCHSACRPLPAVMNPFNFLLFIGWARARHHSYLSCACPAWAPLFVALVCRRVRAELGRRCSIHAY